MKKQKLEVYFRCSKNQVIVFNPNKLDVQLSDYGMQKAVSRKILNNYLNQGLLKFVGYL